MIHVARFILCAIAIALIPAWKLWILGGWIADKRAQKRLALLKDHRESDQNRGLL